LKLSLEAIDSQSGYITEAKKAVNDSDEDLRDA